MIFTEIKENVRQWCNFELPAVTWVFEKQNSPPYHASDYQNGLGLIRLDNTLSENQGYLKSEYDQAQDLIIETRMDSIIASVSINLFGNNALAQLSHLRSSAISEITSMFLRRKGLGLQSVSAVNDLTFLVNEKWEERAQATFLFNIVVKYTRNIDYISGVVIKGNFDNGRILFDLTVP